MNNRLVCRLLLSATLLWTSLAAEGEMSLEEALAYANRPDSDLFRDHRPRASAERVLSTIRKHQAETETFVVSALSKAGRRERMVGREALIKLIFDPVRREAAMRAILATYEFGDLETPFIQALAISGKAEDMPRVVAVISQHPNADLSFELGRILAANSSPAAQNALRQLGAEGPDGSWRSSHEVNRILGSEKVAKANSPHVTETGLRTSVSKNLVEYGTSHFFMWIGAATVIILLLLFIYLKGR